MIVGWGYVFGSKLVVVYVFFNQGFCSKNDQFLGGEGLRYVENVWWEVFFLVMDLVFLNIFVVFQLI